MMLIDPGMIETVPHTSIPDLLALGGAGGISYFMHIISNHDTATSSEAPISSGAVQQCNTLQHLEFQGFQM